jgi:hypothetical protein
MCTKFEGVLALGLFLIGICWTSADYEPIVVGGNANCNSQGSLYNGDACVGGVGCTQITIERCNQQQGWHNRMCQASAGTNPCAAGNCSADNHDVITKGPNPNDPDANPCEENYGD